MLDTVSSAQLDLIIASKPVQAEGGRTFTRLNPISGQLATTAAAASVADAAKAVDAAAAAFPAWSALGPNARRAILLKVADQLSAMAPEFIAAMKAETGSTQAWAGFNCMLAANMMREAASLTTLVAGVTIPSDKPGCVALAVRQPAGVVLGIAPWNAPVILGVRAIATPLACGNTVVLKAAEACPRTHWLIAEAFSRAGAPEGIVSLVTNAPEDAADVVGALIDHPRRQDHRCPRRGATEARSAGTGRQGAAACAQGRRSRRSGQGGGVRRLHEPGPDLHVHRTDHSRRCRL
jgi:acyl-CoA reductase-like NAD-dependent aldehyde dehydrogenase